MASTWCLPQSLMLSEKELLQPESGCYFSNSLIQGLRLSLVKTHYPCSGRQSEPRLKSPELEPPVEGAANSPDSPSKIFNFCVSLPSNTFPMPVVSCLSSMHPDCGLSLFPQNYHPSALAEGCFMLFETEHHVHLLSWKPTFNPWSCYPKIGCVSVSHNNSVPFRQLVIRLS